MTNDEIIALYGTEVRTEPPPPYPYYGREEVENVVPFASRIDNRMSIVPALGDQINSDDSLDDDGELFLDIVQTGTYFVRFVVYLENPDASADYKYATVFTGTASRITSLRRHIASGAAAGTDNENNLTGAVIVPSTAVTATTTGIARVEIEHILDVSVAGRIKFQFSQNTNTASNLTRLKGSYLEWFKANPVEPV